MKTKIKDCKAIAAKWRKSQVIILGIDPRGNWDLALFGDKSESCACYDELCEQLTRAVNDTKAHKPPLNWHLVSGRERRSTARPSRKEAV
jgi:hypothetical protein